MILTLACGCNGNSNSTPPAQNSQTTTDAPTFTLGTTTTEEAKQEIFETTTDVTVDFAYRYDRDIFILIENTSDKPIVDVKLSWICFDNNGFSTSRNGYSNGKAESINMLPGDKKMLSWYDSDGGDNVVAVPTYIKFQNGDVWETEGIKSWSENTAASFNVSDHKSSLSAISNNASKAESNDYLKIVSTDKYNDNMFSSSDDFSFKISNLTSKKIEKIRLAVCEFDKNGYAVSVSPYDSYSRNCRFTGGTVNLAPNATESFVDSLFFEAECTKYKVVVASVEYGDGTEWNNPYLYEWIYSNSNEY